jgi:hypothetical protein
LIPKITVKRVSELTGMNPLTVRHGIAQGTLPIGSAIKNGDNRTYFYIVTQRVADYLGITLEEVLGGNK